MHFINQTLPEILLNDIDSATKTDILSFSCFAGASKRDGNAFCHEVKDSSTLHDQRCAWVVSQHEHRDVIDRVFAPPTPPALIRPRPPNGPEHVSTKNPGTDILESTRRVGFINALRRTAVATQHRFLESARGKSPIVKRSAANSKRVVAVLLGASAKSVQ